MLIKDIIEITAKELQNRGYSIKLNVHVSGDSGIKHFSDLVVRSSKKDVVFSVYFVSIIDETQLINAVARKIDTGFSQIVISRKINMRILDKLEEIPTKVFMDLPSKIYIAMILSEENEKHIDVFCDFLKIFIKSFKKGGKG
ncbi:MAG: hypothetical protein B6U94_01200 [Thermofilum sp. ex4484_79]|nr:MAG: hypothetical protein B6U94_01200 [Thermofilum sp. ex4484_79]